MCKIFGENELQETCLASKEAMPFGLLKKKLFSRLQTMGIRIIKTYEEEWSYIPVGGSLPNTEQKNLAFGAAASMVHPATGKEINELDNSIFNLFKLNRLIFLPSLNRLFCCEIFVRSSQICFCNCKYFEAGSF